MAVTLYTSRVILATLGEVDYGLYNVVGGVVTSFTFVSMAMTNASTRFITYALGKKDDDYLQKVFHTSFLIHVLLAVFILLVAETIGLWFLNTYLNIPGDRMVVANWVFQFSIFTTMINTIVIPFNSTIIAHERMNAFAFISVFDVVMKLIVVYLLILSPVDKFVSYSFLLLVVQAIDFGIYYLYTHNKFQEVKLKIVIDKPIFKEMCGFAGWGIIGNLAGICYTQGLNILLSIFFGPVVNAARGIAVQVQTAVKNFVASFQTAVNPQITKSYAEQDLNRMRNLIFVSCRFSYIIMLILVLPIFLEVDFILSIWLTETPNHTASFIRLILIISLVDCFERPLTIGMNATGQIRKYQIITCSILLLIVPISYILLKAGMAPEVVFVVHFFILIISCIPEIFILRGYINISITKYIKEVVVRSLLITVLSAIIPVLLHIILDKTIWNSLLVMAVAFSSVLIVSYFGGMSKSEKQYVTQLIKSKFQK